MAFEGDLQKFAPAEVDEVGAIILKARELLSDPAKWFKGDFVCEQTGAMCLLGALGYRFADATKKTVLEPPCVAARQAADLLTEILDRDVAAYNDDFATTHADVLTLLDQAAKAPQ